VIVHVRFSAAVLPIGLSNYIIYRQLHLFLRKYLDRLAEPRISL
jgi:hypothetical protein